MERHRCVRKAIVRDQILRQEKRSSGDGVNGDSRIGGACAAQKMRCFLIMTSAEVMCTYTRTFIRAKEKALLYSETSRTLSLSHYCITSNHTISRNKDCLCLRESNHVSKLAYRFVVTSSREHWEPKCLTIPWPTKSSASQHHRPQ